VAATGGKLCGEAVSEVEISEITEEKFRDN
jgi:hypothetical protein